MTPLPVIPFGGDVRRWRAARHRAELAHRQALEDAGAHLYGAHVAGGKVASLRLVAEPAAFGWILWDWSPETRDEPGAAWAVELAVLAPDGVPIPRRALRGLTMPRARLYVRHLGDFRLPCPWANW